MHPYFKRFGEIATSSSVQAEFSDLKNRGFKGQLPIRIDKFIVQHLEFLDSKISLASNEKDIPIKSDSISLSNVYINKNLSKEESFTSTIDNNNSDIHFFKHNDPENVSDISKENSDSNNVSSIYKKNNDNEDISDISMKICDVENVSDISEKNCDFKNVSYDVDFVKESLNESNDKSSDTWNICENWRGLINSSNIKNEYSQKVPKSVSKKRTHPSYLDKCPEWDYLKNTKSLNLPLLINGSKCNAVKQKQLAMTVQETCAFDSLVQLVVSGIAAHETYRNEIQSTPDV